MISLGPPHYNSAEEDYAADTTGSQNSEVEGEFDEDAFDAALRRQLGRFH